MNRIQIGDRCIFHYRYPFNSYYTLETHYGTVVNYKKGIVALLSLEPSIYYEEIGNKEYDGNLAKQLGLNLDDIVDE